MDNQTLSIKLKAYKEGAFEYQKRRHEDWKENYQLYRDKVIVNRITQRQSVNIPLMKETGKTILSKIDDAPDLTFEDLGNDKQKDIYLNEYWQEHFREDKLEIKDIVDKKQVFLYGRSFKKLNIVDGDVTCEILDPMDVLVDRFVDPSDIETAQCIIHQHIFRPLSELENKEKYDQSAVKRLKIYYATDTGLVKAQDNLQSLQARNERLKSLGDTEIDDPQIGEIYVELNEVYIKLWNESEKEFEINLVVTADGEILLKKPLKEVLNIDFFPFVTWGTDIEKQDFWSDGEADTIRTPNKIANAWFSQLVENRSLRNMGMRFYDATVDGFNPQTFIPQPWGFYPTPGDPSKIIKSVDVPDLSESLDELQFVVGIIERSSAATAIEKGTGAEGQITLGEVQLLAAKAAERITSTSKFYRQSWKEYGEKWCELVINNADKLDDKTLYKKSYKDNYYPATISPVDMETDDGYKVIVRTAGEKEKDAMDTLQKFNAVIAQMPNNQALRRIYQKRLMDLIKLSPEEQQEVEASEQQAMPQNPMDMALSEQMKALNGPQMPQEAPQEMQLTA